MEMGEQVPQNAFYPQLFPRMFPHFELAVNSGL
jgi:hypothetical protein